MLRGVWIEKSPMVAAQSLGSRVVAGKEQISRA
jgi:hypothetical protein